MAINAGASSDHKIPLFYVNKQRAERLLQQENSQEAYEAAA